MSTCSATTRAPGSVGCWRRPDSSPTWGRRTPRTTGRRSTGPRPGAPTAASCRACRVAVEQLGIFYNKTLFDAKGFTEPKTLEELKTIMDAFKADKITPLAFGDQPQWPAGHQYSMTLSNIVGREGMDARLYGDKPWNDADVGEGDRHLLQAVRRCRLLPEGPERRHLRGRERAVLRRQGRDDPDGHMADVGDHGQDQGQVRGRVLPIPVDRRILDLAAVRPRVAACSSPRTRRSRPPPSSSSTG